MTYQLQIVRIVAFLETKTTCMFHGILRWVITGGIDNGNDDATNINNIATEMGGSNNDEMIYNTNGVVTQNQPDAAPTVEEPTSDVELDDEVWFLFIFPSLFSYN